MWPVRGHNGTHEVWCQYLKALQSFTESTKTQKATLNETFGHVRNEFFCNDAKISDGQNYKKKRDVSTQYASLNLKKWDLGKLFRCYKINIFPII